GPPGQNSPRPPLYAFPRFFPCLSSYLIGSCPAFLRQWTMGHPPVDIPLDKGIQKSFRCVRYIRVNMGTRVQRSKISKEMKSPRGVPKNCLNTAPVYPSRAEMSSFKRIRVRERSMGFSME